jgi:pimeloyl-ACP methyl ester carboxylesterase
MEEKTFLYNNVPTSYTVYGEGKPVILLHGFGEDSDVWQQQVDFMKPHFRLIVPDIPGSGRSGFLPGANIDTYADVLHHLVENELSDLNENERTISLIGHSMGGYVAIAFAEKYPTSLNKLGFFHSSVFADNEEKKEARKKAITFIQSNGSHNFLKTSTPALFTKAYAASFPEKVEALIETGKSFKPEALVQYYEAMIERPDRREVLTAFEKPVLFIIGEHDTAIPLEISLQQCYLPANSSVHILDKSAHMGMWEETAKVNEILFEFLK